MMLMEERSEVHNKPKHTRERNEHERVDDCEALREAFVENCHTI